MTAAVVARGLQDCRRGVIGYGIGLGLMIVWVMALYPSVETELADYVEAMPETMKSLFGIEDITSLAGFVHAEVFTIMGPLVFLAFRQGDLDADLLPGVPQRGPLRPRSGAVTWRARIGSRRACVRGP